MRIDFFASQTTFCNQSLLLCAGVRQLVCFIQSHLDVERQHQPPPQQQRFKMLSTLILQIACKHLCLIISISEQRMPTPVKTVPIKSQSLHIWLSLIKLMLMVSDLCCCFVNIRNFYTTQSDNNYLDMFNMTNRSNIVKAITIHPKPP